MKNDYDIVQPKASSITESLRSIGYSLETAVADLIDNSITAGAKNIDIDGIYAGTKTKLYIQDDGCGMDEPTLVEAMRLGSTSPKSKRKEKDLGRFGLGLKTATFSQCRKLSVATKKDGKISVRCWDLDLINKTNEWRLLSEVKQEYIDRVSRLEHGTVIVWECLDRVISANDPKAENRFNNKKASLRQHLSITFHRFMESGRLNIRIAGVPVEPWDPFLTRMASFKKEVPEQMACGGKVLIKGLVMPHRSYFKDAEYKAAGFQKGWTQMQGFYVYRADRLLVQGGWLGISVDGVTLRQEHHYDLARICIDIPNDYDFDWDIDIKKSKATPPDYLKDTLALVAKETRKLAYETYSFRGNTKKTRTKTGKTVIPVWNVGNERNGKLYYSINPGNPYVRDILESLDEDNAKKVKSLLKLISETIPAENIGFEATKAHGKQMVNPFEDEPSEKKAIIDEMIASYVRQGYSTDEAMEQVKIILSM